MIREADERAVKQVYTLLKRRCLPVDIFLKMTCLRRPETGIGFLRRHYGVERITPRASMYTPDLPKSP